MHGLDIEFDDWYHGAMKRALALAACLMFTPAVALGDAPTDKDRAREHAQQAADFLDAKNYAQALDAAKRAESLYHAVYHVYVIARSLEGLGRLTEAAESYERILAEPLPSSAPQVFRDAQKESKGLLADLLARTPTVLVRVNGVATEQAQATLDGKTIDISSGLAVRADPGSHVVRVTANGRTPFEKTIVLPAKGGVIVVDALLGLGNGSSNAGRSGGSYAPAIAAFSVGGAALAFGGILGALELGKVNDLDAVCPNKTCPANAQAELDSAKRFATLSTVGFVVAGAGITTGVVLLLVRKKAEPSRAATIVPWVGVRSAGIAGVF